MTLDDRSHTISSSSESRNYADNTLRSVATAVNRFLASLPAARQSALALEQELSTFLRSDLKLALSEEKTKVTHLNDGFEFLGLRI